jgi:hypothetical protein
MGWKTKVLITACIILHLPSYSEADWHYVSPMPVARYGHDSTFGSDGRIYVMGGFVWYTHDGMHSNLAYDPRTDTWTLMDPAPGWMRPEIRFIYHAESKMWRAVRKKYKTIDTYEMDTPRDMKKGEKRDWKVMPGEVNWDQLRTTDFQRQGDGVSIASGTDGLIYWTGGNGMWGMWGENCVFPYNPITMKWDVDVSTTRVTYETASYRNKTIYSKSIPDMLEGRIDHKAVATSDGRIWVMGGRRDEIEPSGIRDEVRRTGKSEVSRTLECYDPRTNTWEYRAPMPDPRFLFAAVVGPDDRIYVFGGIAEFPQSNNPRILNSIDIYHPKTNTWSTPGAMPTTLCGHAAALGADGKIYLLGGGTEYSDSPLREVRSYDPVSGIWKKAPEMNRHRDSFSAVATPDGKIYAIGGTDVGAYKIRQTINVFLPQKHRLYEGQVQKTAEVWNIFE